MLNKFANMFDQTNFTNIILAIILNSQYMYEHTQNQAHVSGAHLTYRANNKI